MFFIAGITGQIGGAAARALLAEGKRLRALVRAPAKAAAWQERGVELRVGDLTDSDALAQALEGVEGAFLMQPTPMGVTRDFPEAHALTDAIVGALRRSPPPRAVVLSSVGSEQASGLGNITQTHILERALASFTFPITIVRPGSLLENNLPLLAHAGATGVFETFMQPIDRAFPMTATADVGAEVARLLVEGWEWHKVVEIGAYYTPQAIAAAIGEALGKPVEARAIPRDHWLEKLGYMGLTGEKAENWAEMLDGLNSGWINFGQPGTQKVPARTTPVEVFAGATSAASL